VPEEFAQFAAEVVERYVPARPERARAIGIGAD
jgi:hypothetical protein